MPLAHTTTIFDQELEHLTGNIRMMGDFAGSQFKNTWGMTLEFPILH